MARSKMVWMLSLSTLMIGIAATDVFALGRFPKEQNKWEFCESDGGDSSPTPEPASAALLASGLAAYGAYRSKKRKK